MTQKIFEAAEMIKSRRDVLKAGLVAGITGAAAIIGDSLLFQPEVQAQGKGPAKGGAASSKANDIVIMNVALALEHQAIAAYAIGADTGLLSDKVKALAVHFQSQHMAHRDALEKTIKSFSGTPVAAQAKYEFDTSKIKAEADVLAFALNLEAGAASAYLGVLKSIFTKDLLPVVAGIACDESQHAAVLRYALGLQPAPDAVVK
ncbi:MAG TPA: ferritin-like domain-containing protein [Acidobacteriota bacterium]|nr:ferritin-like domain-containing protein [Acidobacteriota bacterium]